MSTEANKAVLCEKPIDLDINKVNECRDRIAGSSNLIQIGFNRRFDKSHASLQKAYCNGEIGDLEKIIIKNHTIIQIIHIWFQYIWNNN